MPIERTGELTGGAPARQLREALKGIPVQPVSQQGADLAEVQDQVSLTDQMGSLLRTNHDEVRKVQEQMLENRILLQGLGGIRDEIARLRETLTDLGNDSQSIALVSETISNINRLVEESRFNNIPLLSDFQSERLGLTNISAASPTQPTGQTLLEAQSRVEDRIQKAQVENLMNRRQLDALAVSRENISNALTSDRINQIRNMMEAVRTLREELPRRSAEINLTPSRVMELI